MIQVCGAGSLYTFFWDSIRSWGLPIYDSRYAYVCIPFEGKGIVEIGLCIWGMHALEFHHRVI